MNSTKRLRKVIIEEVIDNDKFNLISIFGAHKRGEEETDGPTDTGNLGMPVRKRKGADADEKAVPE